MIGYINAMSLLYIAILINANFVEYYYPLHELITKTKRSNVVRFACHISPNYFLRSTNVVIQ